jgi:hypothetical protein
VPYWLDGFIPLAYLLDDEKLKKRAKKYVDAILDRQKPDGWICPCEDNERSRYDLWAVFLICKVLMVYHQCSGDSRAEKAVHAALKQLHGCVRRGTLFGWASSRWYECLIPIFWLYGKKQEPWLLDLAAILSAQGFDFRKLLELRDYKVPQEKKKDRGYMDHVVNIAMMLKSLPLFARVHADGDENEATKAMLAKLFREHGTAVGHFSGDEHLSGVSPIRGTECCGVAEAMYSYEHLIALTGDMYWAELLETLAFNTFPATISPDMWSHQYDQMVNQPQCTVIPDGDVHFVSNNGTAHVFGLEPHYGCCTANFGQAWPKFALSTFMRSGKGLAVTAIAPVVLDTTVNGVRVRCELVTDYPFKDSYRLKVEAERPVSFELALRIPSAESATVDGAPATPGAFHRITREWRKEELKVEFKQKFEFVERPNGLKVLKRGILFYALAIGEKWERLEYEKNGVPRKFPYCDYDLTPTTAWNYGFAGGLKPGKLKLQSCKTGEMPFSPEGAPVWVEAEMVKIPWSSKNGICTPAPDSLKLIGKPEKKKLIPYGCTNLRMTEMPEVDVGIDAWE